MQWILESINCVLLQVPDILLFLLRTTAGQKFWLLIIGSFGIIAVMNLTLTLLIGAVCYSFQVTYLDPFRFTNWLLVLASMISLYTSARLVYQGIGLFLNTYQATVINMAKQTIFVRANNICLIIVGMYILNLVSHRFSSCFVAGFRQRGHMRQEPLTT